MQTLVARIVALSLAVAALALCFLAWQAAQRDAVPETGTSYQAVALMNGQVYFGRLERAADGYLALRDVYYVQTRQNPDTRAVANVLVKRGSESHGPDRMLVNRQQVLLVEPVGADSKIAKLIAEQHAK
jgi:hypothetical protein